MYLQITTKCNMKCSHCCFSCNKNGKHGDYHLMLDALQFANDHTDMIAIGGGEPTLHPRFFDILKKALWEFEYVWMATNGSKTKTMQRLCNIIEQEDWLEEENDIIFQENKLTVALSQDCFHDPINSWVTNTWERNKDKFGFEIKNIIKSSNGVIAQGRAKRTGSGWNTNDCVCDDLIITPNGKIKMCGCTKSPIIGSIWVGIEPEWKNKMDENNFYSHGCYKHL